MTVGQLYSFRTATSDATTWTGTPSEVYIDSRPPGLRDGEIPARQCPTPPSPGDFLIAINGKGQLTRSTADNIFEQTPPQDIVSLRLYHTGEGSVTTCELQGAHAARIGLRDLGLAVLIRQVETGEAADLAGIRPGDVLVGIGDRPFARRLRTGPFEALVALFQGAESQVRFKSSTMSGVQAAREAQYALQAFRPGDRVRFHVLRGGDFQLTDVQLQGPPLWQWVVLGLGLLGLIYMGLSLTRLCLWVSSSDPQIDRLFAATTVYFLLMGVMVQADPGGIHLTTASRLLGTAALVALLLRGFPSPPNLSRPPVLFLFPAAFGITYFLWFWHRINPLGEDRGYFSLSGIRVKLFGVREPFLSTETAVSLMTVVVLVFALLYLASFWRRFIAPMSPRHRAHRQLSRAAQVGTAEDLQTFLNRDLRSFEKSFYAARFFRLIRRLNRDPADEAVELERRYILEEDEGAAANALTPIDWSEIALPVLGFLGTVIGLARSLADVQSLSEPGAGVAVSELLATILSAFEGVGYAFDTTFLGLASMLLVAGAHATLRKQASHRLDEVGAVFRTAIDRWRTASPARDLQSATADRANLRTMAEDVLLMHPSAFVHDMRRILLRPSVMFERLSPPPDEHLREVLHEKAGGEWHYAGLGLSRAAATGLVLAKSRNGSLWLARLDLNITEPAVRETDEAEPLSTLESSDPDIRRIEAIFPAADTGAFTLYTETGRLLSGTLNDSLLVDVGLPNGEDHGQIRRILPMKVDDQDLLVLCRDHDEGCELLGLRAGDTQVLELGLLQEQLHEEAFAGHDPSGMVFRLGRRKTQGKSWIVQRKKIVLRPGDDSGARAKSGQPTTRTEYDTAIWRQDSEPRRLLPLGESEILVATAKALFHWDFTRGSRRLGSWPEAEGTPKVLVRGAERWIAAIRGEILRMWQVRRSGVLIPFEGDPPHYTVAGVTDDDGRVQATADGRLLVALTGIRTLSTWRFPKLALDG